MCWSVIMYTKKALKIIDFKGQVKLNYKLMVVSQKFIRAEDQLLQEPCQLRWLCI